MIRSLGGDDIACSHLTLAASLSLSDRRLSYLLKQPIGLGLVKAR
jgi:hypothetical protein